MGSFKHHVIIGLMAANILFLGCAEPDPYIAAALKHADQAVTNGQRKDNNALAEQATVALRYAYLAERNKKDDSRLQEGIRHLKEAIQHARYGRSDAGVQAVEEAYRFLADIQ